MNQREIKFRANETGTNFKVTGYYVTFLDMTKEGSPRVHAILDDRGHWTYVKPESVREYTGLKDKNGKEIYEGDILQRRNFASWVVSWIGTGLVISNVTNPGVYYPLTWHELTYREVIGNIYENPEMLENGIVSPSKTAAND